MLILLETVLFEYIKDKQIKDRDSFSSFQNRSINYNR